MFSKILIANRGEIAVRIIRACKEMGIETVAVYSQTDKELLHVALADESYCIGPAAAVDSYLNEEQIIRTALASGAQAIHPGYGFLSENVHFARLCQRYGIVFIGPTPEVMDKISDKAQTKTVFSSAGLTIIPGSETLATLHEAAQFAEEIGYPVMLKASAGGGGRGIRLITSKEELEQQFPLAVSEAESAFGDGRVYIEKYIYPARHVEVQVLADEMGNVVCLGERDCSIQRRHQKLIEEAPCPKMQAHQREALMKVVEKAVKKIGYEGAGTLEFLMDKDGKAWFMEMNVRLQVEHSVTELLTKIDLVKWQIRIAAGKALTFSQKSIPLVGAVIECRINARSPGTLKALHVPGGPFVRFDTYLVQGDKITPFYDSMLGKLVVYAGTREEAVRKMRAALCELVIDGVETNIAEQLEILGDGRFLSGEYDLRLMEGR